MNNYGKNNNKAFVFLSTSKCSN